MRLRVYGYPAMGTAIRAHLTNVRDVSRLITALESRINIVDVGFNFADEV